MREPRTLRGPAARALDLLFLTRPAALVPLWIFYFAGFGAAAGGGRAAPGGPAPGPFALTAQGALGFLALSAVLAGGYVLNQVRDREGDRLNEKLFLLSRGIVTLRAAWILFGALWVAGAVLSFRLPAAFGWLAAASAALCVSYSLPPVRAKAIFPLDLVWNGVGFGGLTTAAGWVAAGGTLPGASGMCASYALAVAGVIASTTIPDADGDRATGLRTAAVALGSRGASALAIALVTAGGVVGALVRDPTAIVGSALSLPMLVRAHATSARRDRTLANQVAVAAFAVGVAARSAYPILLLGAAFAASRAYYRRRFGLTYPGPGAR